MPCHFSRHVSLFFSRLMHPTCAITGIPACKRLITSSISPAPKTLPIFLLVTKPATSDPCPQMRDLLSTMASPTATGVAFLSPYFCNTIATDIAPHPAYAYVGGVGSLPKVVL